MREPGPRWRSWTARCLIACGAGSALALLGGMCGAWSWRLEQCAHFRVQECAGLAVAVAGLALLRSWIACAPFAALLGIGAAPLLPYEFGHTDAAGSGRKLRVTTLNVEWINRDFARLRRAVRESSADVLLLLEVGPDILRGLEPELGAYGQRLEIPRPDPFGIALYSRLPMQARGVREFGNGGMPAIEAELELDGQRLTLVAIHAPPPVTAENTTERDRVITSALERLRLFAGPAILLGDFNTTPWTNVFERCTAEYGFRDARRGFGILPSWPTAAPLLGIPIDHCLVHGDLRVLAARVGEECGSDHLPLMVELAIGR